MKPVFKEYNQGQTTLFPVSLDSKIVPDSPVRLVNQVVDNLESKIRKILEYIDEGIMQDHQPDDEPPTPINSKDWQSQFLLQNRP